MKRALSLLLSGLLGCSQATSLGSGPKVIFESTAVSPVTVEKDGDKLTVKYKSKTETGGIILTKDDHVTVDLGVSQSKSSASGTFLKIFEIIIKTVADALF